MLRPGEFMANNSKRLVRELRRATAPAVRRGGQTCYLPCFRFQRRPAGHRTCPHKEERRALRSSLRLVRLDLEIEATTNLSIGVTGSARLDYYRKKGDSRRADITIAAFTPVLEFAFFHGCNNFLIIRQ